ncbi:MAG: transglutaminase-like cysteine peptidase, partial [Dongiaceae bacterium]
WAPPSQFLAKGGECEDYAIAKFATLRALGFTADQVRLVLVENTITNKKHAIGAVYLNGQTLLMDNMSQSLRTPEQVDYYRPIASLDEDRLWVHIRPQSPRNVAALQRTDKQG